MKKLSYILLFLLTFMFATTTLADDRGKYGHKKYGKDSQFYHKDGTKRYDGWAYYHGHQPRPYNHQHRDYYPHHFHNYNYEGHWNSWQDWERYYHRNPHIYRHGRYEKYNNQLFFLFDDGLNRFVFSIGR